MTKPNRHFDACADGTSARRGNRAFSFFAAIAAIAAAAVMAAALAPSAALAQDPGVDQYAPTPSGGGNTNPTPNPDSGTPVPQSGSNDGGDTPSTDPGTTGTTVPPTTDTTVTPDATGTSGGTGNGHNDKSENKSDRTLDGLAVAAQQQRDARNGDRQATTQLSSTSGGESGIGWIVWVALGLIIIWAVAMGIVNYRRRAANAKDAKARDARNGRTGEQQTA